VLLYDQKIFQPFEVFVLFRALNFYIIVFIFLIIKFIFKSTKKNV
jgi:hypothetical protein